MRWIIVKRRKFKPEEIISKLREAKVMRGQGKTVNQAWRHKGISEYAYYRWRKVYGGMKVDRAKGLKDTEGGRTS